MEDNNLSVRIWAAYALLHVNTPKAVKALKEIVKNDSGIMGFNAEMTLDEFKKGNIKPAYFILTYIIQVQRFARNYVPT